MTRRFKITKRAVDALKASGSRYISWDTELAGFGVRVSANGGKSTSSAIASAAAVPVASVGQRLASMVR